MRSQYPKAEGVSLTRLENYCVVYLATLESRDVICANWRTSDISACYTGGSQSLAGNFRTACLR
jgi:hypothetical protein